MENFHSNIWGDVVAPTSFLEIMNYTVDSKKEVFYWRGQSNISWTVDSSIVRRAKHEKVSDINRHIGYWEKNLIEDAKQKLYHYGTNGHILSDIELLAKLQHFGASTRLLDFSKNILIALWFCASENREKTGLLIGISTNIIRGAGEGRFDFNQNYDDFIEKVLSSKGDIWFIDAPSIVTRITSQSSVFLCSKCIETTYGSFSFPEKKYYSLIAISPNLKKEIIIVLSKYFNITPYTIFPDIEGFAKANSTQWKFSQFDRW